MLIRSQDKTMLTNDIRFYIIKDNGNWSWKIQNKKLGTWGIYNSEYECFKVFDMIYEACESGCKFFQMPSEDEVQI